MDSEDIYQNVEHRDIADTTGPRIQINGQDEGKDKKRRGSVCLVLMTVCLGLICVVLLIFIILQFIIITAERDLVKSYKNTVEEFNQTINSLQDNYTDLMTEQYQLNNRFNSLSQKKMELESKVATLTEKLKIETSKQGYLWGPDGLFLSNESKSWSESRQFCRDRGADLIIINTEEKQRHITSFMKEREWIGLTDIENEGIMKWVDNSPLKQGFWFKGQPNSLGGNEDCIILDPSYGPVNNWNDYPCSDSFKCICEK